MAITNAQLNWSTVELTLKNIRTLFTSSNRQIEEDYITVDFFYDINLELFHVRHKLPRGHVLGKPEEYTRQLPKYSCEMSLDPNESLTELADIILSNLREIVIEHCDYPV